MEQVWLAHLAHRPEALSSLIVYLQKCITDCPEYALEPGANIERLRGKRDAFREILGYINNNKRAVEKQYGVAV